MINSTLARMMCAVTMLFSISAFAAPETLAPQGFMEYRFGESVESLTKNPGGGTRYDCEEISNSEFKTCFKRAVTVYGLPATATAFFRKDEKHLRVVSVGIELPVDPYRSCSDRAGLIFKALLEKYSVPSKIDTSLGRELKWYFKDGVSLSAFAICRTEADGFVAVNYEKSDSL